LSAHVAQADSQTSADGIEFMDPAVKTLKAALESNSKYGAECASPKRAIPGAMFHAMEMQRVPLHQTFYEACYVGSGGQMSPV